MDKIYNLYKNGIYNDEDYSKKKENWINRLKNLKSVKEEDFLNQILPFVKNNAFTTDDLNTIKYVISGKYEEDRIKKEKEETRKIKKQREELKAQKEKHDRELSKEKKERRKKLARNYYKILNNEIYKVRSFIEKKLDPYSKKGL